MAYLYVNSTATDDGTSQAKIAEDPGRVGATCSRDCRDSDGASDGNLKRRNCSRDRGLATGWEKKEIENCDYRNVADHEVITADGRAGMARDTGVVTGRARMKIESSCWPSGW